ncbi:response regulator transcription factor [Oceanicaulis sp. LC35]|uniref:helix-turn-helix transcriptional regulator n=1 Tax=Oceanicaulis sp. LC35 TaxID=3349635 RepID=UPI003F85FB77
MTSAERRRLTAFIAGRRWASLAVICAALTGAALIVFMLAQPEWVFRSPVLMLLLPVLIVTARCWRAPLQWRGALADLKADAVETASGVGHVHWRRRPGLFSGMSATLELDGKQFALEDDMAGAVTPGIWLSVRYAPASGALLSIERASQAEAGLDPVLADQLTERERALLALLAEGLSDKAIARRLNLSPTTVRTYNSTLYAKLGVQGRGEAVNLARGGIPTSAD